MFGRVILILIGLGITKDYIELSQDAKIYAAEKRSRQSTNRWANRLMVEVEDHRRKAKDAQDGTGDYANETIEKRAIAQIEHLTEAAKLMEFIIGLQSDAL